MSDITEISIFLASPSDVQEEREAVNEAVDELNDTVAPILGLRFKLLRWEMDARPGLHRDGTQAHIESLIDPRTVDIVLGIFWTRFGTQGPDGRAHTQREIEVAFEHWQQHGRPQVCVYFKDAPYSPESPQELDQWKAVLTFQENFPQEGLWWKFN